MAGLKVIITGATGMVGEGVLLACLAAPEVERVLLVSRRHYELEHPKLSELLLDDLTALAGHEVTLSGYEACFFCAGVSSLGMDEAQYTKLTYDLTLAFAGQLARLNPGMRFVYVSGASTDTSEHGRLMWARVKGRTENALFKLPFAAAYAFRPGIMSPMPGQKSLKSWVKPLKFLYPVVGLLAPKQLLTLEQVGQAMIHVVSRGYPKSVCEIADIRSLAG